MTDVKKSPEQDHKGTIGLCGNCTPVYAPALCSKCKKVIHKNFWQWVAG